MNWQTSPFERVEQIIRSTVKLDSSQAIAKETELHSLGIDSLTMINVLVVLAEQHAVDLESFADGLDMLTTVGQLCALDERFAAASAAAPAANAHLFKYFDKQKLHYEYGLDGIRTFPWQGVNTPIGSGYCIVRPRSTTLLHVNEPADEDELFVGIEGKAVVVLNGEDHVFGKGDQVFIPRGMSHCIRNDSDTPFHFFTVWWNQSGSRAYLAGEVATVAQAPGVSTSETLAV